MSEAAVTLLIWLPAATVLPFVVALATGSNWRGAIIEAALFAALGLLIYPTLIALVISAFTRDPNINALFITGFVLAALSVVLLRRQARGRYRRW